MRVRSSDDGGNVAAATPSERAELVRLLIDRLPLTADATVVTPRQSPRRRYRRGVAKAHRGTGAGSAVLESLIAAAQRVANRKRRVRGNQARPDAMST